MFNPQMQGRQAQGMGGQDPLAGLLGGGAGPGVNPMDGLNAIQPPPPQMGGDDAGSLMAMLGMGGGMQGSIAPSGSGMLDPMTFGMQAGPPPVDPFSSTPFDGMGVGGSPPLVDQLEGMGLGAQGQPPMQGGSPGGIPPGLAALFSGAGSGYGR